MQLDKVARLLGPRSFTFFYVERCGVPAGPFFAHIQLAGFVNRAAYPSVGN